MVDTTNLTPMAETPERTNAIEERKEETELSEGEVVQDEK